MNCYVVFRRGNEMKKQIKPVVAKGLSKDAFFKEIREFILAARSAVVRSVDTIQVMTNFEIGRRIVEHE